MLVATRCQRIKTGKNTRALLRTPNNRTSFLNFDDIRAVVSFKYLIIGFSRVLLGLLE